MELVELNKEICSDLMIPDSYDFVKVDVEGFEYQVLDALKVNVKYLYIEFSQARECSYEIPALLEKIKEQFGKFNILYCDRIDKYSKHTTGNLLVKFIG
ncbi:hypothetical protein ES703_113302 [subsurface metagenome]